MHAIKAFGGPSRVGVINHDRVAISDKSYNRTPDRQVGGILNGVVVIGCGVLLIKRFVPGSSITW